MHQGLTASPSGLSPAGAIHASVLDAVPEEPKLLSFLRYWNACRDGAAFPGRQSIDPVEIPTLLPYLAITEAGNSPLECRVRLAGTAVVEWMGRDPSGTILHPDQPGDAFVCRLHRNAMKLGAPLYGGGPWHSVRQVLWRAHTLSCPLSSDGLTITQIITCITVEGFAGAESVPGGRSCYGVPVCPEKLLDT